VALWLGCCLYFAEKEDSGGFCSLYTPPKIDNNTFPLFKQNLVGANNVTLKMAHFIRTFVLIT